jgi:Flp pilus assembly protein TadG
MRLFGRPGKQRRRDRGQALVEFSLIIPIFMTLIVAIAEFSFILTIKIGVTDAAQDAVLIAAQMGNSPDADYAILSQIEKDMTPPANKTKIQTVEIFWTNEYGNANLGEMLYRRTGVLQNQAKTASVPYTADAGGAYPSSVRCNTLYGIGCASGHGTVDWIGVKITYQYSWVTPLPGLIGLSGAAPTFVQSSVCRIEPIQ